MGETCIRDGEVGNSYKILCRKTKGKKPLDDLSTDGGTIITSILKKGGARL
jgi:hypothetical protein